jgi:hypothetical protein
MSLQQDWEGVVEVKARLWEAELDQQKLLAQMPRIRSVWRRHAGAWLMRVGDRLTQWGKQMAECERDSRMTVTG